MAGQKELCKEAAARLEEEGYEYAQCCVSGGFFDIAARRERMLLIKVLEDINAFAAGQASGMKNAAAMLESGCFVLGEIAGGQKLRGGVLYQRHDVDAGEVRTLGMLIDGQEIFVRKNRREYVKLDGKRLAKAREDAGIALRELAQKSGISKDTLCRYENNASMALEVHVDALEEIMRTSLREEVEGMHARAASFDFYGMAAARLAKPFELVAREKQGGAKIVFGAGQDKRAMHAKAALCEEFSRISKADCCFMVEKSKEDSVLGVPVIRKSELDGMGAGQIVKLLRERKG